MRFLQLTCVEPDYNKRHQVNLVYINVDKIINFHSAVYRRIIQDENGNAVYENDGPVGYKKVKYQEIPCTYIVVGIATPEDTGVYLVNELCSEILAKLPENSVY